MTDNEIIKALECCTSEEIGNRCPVIVRGVMKDALSLINRQKAEIESLRNIVKTDFLTAREQLKLFRSEIGQIRSEAIKEFASKLTPRLLKEMDEQGLMPPAYVKKVHAYTEIELFINEIVKEMTEDEEICALLHTAVLKLSDHPTEKGGDE